MIRISRLGSEVFQTSCFEISEFAQVMENLKKVGTLKLKKLLSTQADPLLFLGRTEGDLPMLSKIIYL